MDRRTPTGAAFLRRLLPVPGGDPDPASGSGRAVDQGKSALAPPTRPVGADLHRDERRDVRVRAPGRGCSA
ncbi:hypothetical protein GCM10010234_00500 [Streptomyces hawaiiensis]